MEHGPRLGADGTATFRVWAPRAAEVALWLDGATFAMTPGAGGWFSVAARAGAGARYGFCLDGGPPRPDPASRRQPDGVHAPSALVDLGDLPCRVRQWEVAPLERAVLYELHVGAFTPQGTCDAVIERLDHLVALGVTHVEIMPVNGFNGVWNWGYDGVAWYAVHEPYGGPEGLARLVDACHARGLGAILDVVHNHLGPSGNYLPEFGPYLADGARSTWGEQLNLDGSDSDPVRAFITGNVVQWLRDYRFDGLRLDAVHALADQSARHILAEIADTVAGLEAELGRPLTLIAESDRNDPTTVTPRSGNGLGMHAQWADDLHHAIHTAVTGERDGYYVDYQGLPDVARAYRDGFLYNGRYSPYRRRTVGAPLPDAIGGHHLVTCIQNHDQVGNRPAGERLTTLVPSELVRVAIVLLLASPTTPLLWMGEEYGETNPFPFFTSHPEEALGHAVSAGRVEEFADFASWRDAAVPDPQDPATFQRAKLDWERLGTAEGGARLALWRALLTLRAEHPALADRRRDHVTVHAADAETLLVERRTPDAAVVIAANLGDAAAALALPAAPAVPAAPALPAGRWAIALDTQDPAFGADGEKASVEGSTVIIAARSAVLLTAGCQTTECQTSG